jgi:hypothetical protein
VALYRWHERRGSAYGRDPDEQRPAMNRGNRWEQRGAGGGNGTRGRDNQGDRGRWNDRHHDNHDSHGD